ncbi:MAG: DUF134 domain-containing protein [Lachnospiraceae bacterium]|nr:DUF134 domain-containing protein [Lachnospiraceae bacterium]
MPRVPKCRKICGFPDYYSFVPEEGKREELDTVTLTLDEYETIRLLDAMGLNQEQCATSMGVARTTVTAMYENARKKIAKAITEGMRLSISGGYVTMNKDRTLFDAKLKEKGEKEMRVAVTYENGEVFGHFGKTEHFKIYDCEDGKVTGSQVVDTNGTGHGALAGFLKAADVDVLICGGIGGGAQMALNEAKITLYAGASGSTDAVVDAFLAGSLAQVGEANCDHHHHEGHEDHDCSHGGCCH